MDYRKKNEIMKALTNPEVYKELAKNPKFKKELDMIGKKAEGLNKGVSLSSTLIGFLMGLGLAGLKSDSQKEVNKRANELRTSHMDKFLYNKK